MYKAKQNISTGTKDFISGKLYSAEEVDGLDLSNFELIGEEKKTDKPVETTDQSAQAGSNDEKQADTLE